MSAKLIHTIHAAQKNEKPPGMCRGPRDWRPPCRSFMRLETAPWVSLSEEPFALRFLARQLACTANRLGFLARLLLGRLLEVLLELHLAENAFALQLFLQSAERLIDIVVANTDLHVVVTTFPV